MNLAGMQGPSQVESMQTLNHGGSAAEKEMNNLWLSRCC